MENIKQTIEHAEKCKLTLTRGAKGDYRWEITIYGRTEEDAVASAFKVDQLILDKLKAPEEVETTDKKEE